MVRPLHGIGLKIRLKMQLMQLKNLIQQLVLIIKLNLKLSVTQKHGTGVPI